MGRLWRPGLAIRAGALHSAPLLARVVALHSRPETKRGVHICACYPACRLIAATQKTTRSLHACASHRRASWSQSITCRIAETGLEHRQRMPQREPGGTPAKGELATMLDVFLSALLDNVLQGPTQMVRADRGANSRHGSRQHEQLYWCIRKRFCTLQLLCLPL